MTLKISKMEDRHTAEIAQIERECFSEPWQEEQLREELDNDCAVFFVAEADGKTMGYIGCHVVLDEGYITNVAVGKHYRGFGIGYALVSKITVYAKENQLSFVTLEARESNRSAISLYKKSGYKVVGKRRSFYTLPIEDAVLMTLDLKRNELKNNEDISD